MTRALPETCPTPLILDAGGRALYLGPAFTVGAHRNAVAVLAVGLDGAFGLDAAGAAPAPGAAAGQQVALIAPGQWHHLDARGRAMAFLYLDADDLGWRQLQARLADQPATLPPTALRRALWALWQVDGHASAWVALLDLLRLPVAAAPDATIAKAMAAVAQAPHEAHGVAVHAAAAGCSISTFQRRFRAQAGLPWRRWRLWQRLRRAACAVCEGHPLTEAALDAGFASGAHFSDSFRAMFGLAPSQLRQAGVAWRTLSALESAPADGPGPPPAARSGPRRGPGG